jgi:hypothetical protein
MEVRAGGRVTLVVGRATVSPAGNDGDAVRAIVPVKPPMGVTVIVELFDAPPGTSVRKSGDVDMANVGPVTVTRISTEWKMVPLDASTLTV